MIQELFAPTCKAIHDDHKKFRLYGAHDFYHALRVAEVAYKIALDEWHDPIIATLATLAGLCHNADRLIQAERSLGRGKVPDDEVRQLVAGWLVTTTNLPMSERKEVVDAVLKHEDKNSTTDSKVLIALTDADRVVNLEADVIIRAGQHFHDLPAVDFQHFTSAPNATYRNPASVLRDITFTLEWVDSTSPYCIRTALGKELGEKRAAVILDFTDTLRKQLQESGLLKDQ